MKILLADPSSVWCDVLEEQLNSHYTVLRCEDGADVMPMLLEQCPDLLVLNLEMPHIDGLTLLHMIHASGIETKLLVTANVFTRYALSILAEFGVSHMLSKPCTVCAVMTQIYQLLHYTEDGNNISDPETDLLILGFRMNLCGYECLRTAIRLLREDPDQPVSKVLYPNVAKICGGSSQRVERAMRNAISDAWKRRDDRIWMAYFTPNRNGDISQPSNGDFITRIALRDKRKRACG